MPSPYAYWTGRCQLSATSPAARRWEGESDEAVTVVVVLAASADDMRTRLLARLDADGLELRRLDAVETLLQRCRREGLVPGLVELAHTTSPQRPVAYGAWRRKRCR